MKTVTIGIPAYNEQDTIGNLLNSIFAQKEDGYRLEKIIVMLDGSTDTTEEQVKKFNDTRIECVNDGQRLGKTSRMNQIMKQNTSDILVFLDADVVLKNQDSITQLVNAFTDQSIGMVNGRLIAKNTNGFVQQSILLTIKVYEKYVRSINNGNNVYAVKGAFIALSRELAKTIIPADVFANDTYLYLDCKQKGLQFRFVPKAEAWYSIPSNIYDQIHQNSRFVDSHDSLRRYFNTAVDKEFDQKHFLLYMFMLEGLLRHPVLGLTIFCINLYSKLVPTFKKKSMQGKWELVRSTKNNLTIK